MNKSPFLEDKKNKQTLSAEDSDREIPQMEGENIPPKEPEIKPSYQAEMEEMETIEPQQSKLEDGWLLKKILIVLLIILFFLIFGLMLYAWARNMIMGQKVDYPAVIQSSSQMDKADYLSEENKGVVKQAPEQRFEMQGAQYKAVIREVE